MYDTQLQTLQQAKKVRAAYIINELSYVHKLHDYAVWVYQGLDWHMHTFN